ncbi:MULTISPECIES: hypothetical protein [unclassified Paenibacillus]|uniref:hypothetical protein n=1 Tax=unclassified Paenibacillus TaxID=185978 RepID=UPI001AE82B88|nr:MULTISPECIES: hypothetical protein [unclassified Paenibacillus]MBP1157675.1 hypothetical protein [Paenibacillus sp. PvP091]MBP1171588.1 hypothetical protein [Paenibacillus sp. PvR098]MBP2437969.1 hypothetical protein [Paenibacillus sp. PvP052]
MKTVKLILDKLKETFEYNGSTLSERESANVWVMASAMAEVHEDLTVDNAIKVRLVLRTTDKNGTNPYVDGTDI